MSGHFEFKLKSIYLNGLRTTNMIGPFKSIDFRFAPAFIFEFNFCLCFRSDLIWNFIMIGSTRTHLHGKLFNWPSVFVLLCFVLVKCCFQESNTPPTKQNCPCNAFTRFYKFQMVFCYVLNAKRTILIHILFLSLHILIFAFEEVWSQENKLSRLSFVRSDLFFYWRPIRWQHCLIAISFYFTFF